MKGTRKREFPFHHAPGKKLFQIVVKMSDAPGSYSSILNALGRRVNLIATGTYTLGDGTAIFSGFAESLYATETPKTLSELVMATNVAREVQINEGESGILVDSFHTGLEVGGEEYMLLRRDGLAHVFSEVAKLLGSGGESLLYMEGVAMGERNAHRMVEVLGIDQVRSKAQYLRSVLSAQGWGVLESGGAGGGGVYHVRVSDCFECSDVVDSRDGCNFLRGYLEGSASATYKVNFSSTEVKCTLRGDPQCEFLLAPKAEQS